MKVEYCERRTYRFYCPNCSQLYQEDEEPDNTLMNGICCHECGHDFSDDTFISEEE